MATTELDAKTARPAIRQDPLPQAGDSLREELNEQLYGTALPWWMGAVLLVVWAGYEWWRYLLAMPVTLGPTVMTSVLALGVTVVALVKVPRALKAADRIKKGIRGEMHVGQYLGATCVGLGYRVFHDVPAEGSGGKFNIDHVLIGPGGVFSVETKNWALPAKGTKAEMVYQASTGSLREPGGGRYHDVEVSQAKNNASHLRKLLGERTGRASVYVTPVLILPGWWITDETPFPKAIWILGNETLHKWLAKEPERLSGEEVAGLSKELENYVRNFGK